MHSSADSSQRSSPMSWTHSPSPNGALSTSSPSSPRLHGRFWLGKCTEQPLKDETRRLAKIQHETLGEELEHMIEKDVHRVGWPQNDSRYDALNELLRRLTRYLPTYNQALSFICAFCLDNFEPSYAGTLDAAETIVLTLLFAPPYRLHWLLSPRTCFLQQFIDRFDFLVARVLPDTYLRLTEAGFETVFYAVDWFTTFFSNSISKECCCIVWDVLIVDQLEDALFLTGIAVLRCIEPIISLLTPDELFLNFKTICRESISPRNLRGELQTIVRALVGSDAVPRSMSTIGELEKSLADPEDILIQTPFDATFLMRAVQLDDASRIQLELKKYSFPKLLLDYALFRAVLLGHAASVASIMRSYHARVDEGMLSPLRASALLNHPHVLRALLWFAFRQNNESKKEFVRYSDSAVLVSNETALVASLVREVKAVKLAYEFEEESLGAIQDVLLQRMCWCCGSYGHTDPCPGSNRGFQVFPTQIPPYCTNCKCSFSSKRTRTTCTRCRLVFCDRCADTFRTIDPGRALRACENCHHFWGSCDCGQSSGVFCNHVPVDLVRARSDSSDSSSKGNVVQHLNNMCECEACLGTFVRIGGKRHLPAAYGEYMEHTALEALNEMTLSVKRESLKINDHV